jgi:integrase
MSQLVKQSSAASLVLRAPQVTQFIERSISPATREVYGRALRQFFAFARVEQPQDVTPEHVRAYRDYLMGKLKLKDNTVRVKIAAVRALFEYLKRAGLIVTNPADGYLVVVPNRPDNLRNDNLSVEEVQQLLAAPPRGEIVGARDYALMLFLLRTSVRVSEACSLRLSDIEQGHIKKARVWVATFKAKGGVTRTIPIPDDVKAAIDHYLDLDARRRGLLKTAGEEAFVFQPTVNYRTLEFDKPLTRTRVWQIVGHWCKVAGLKTRGPHAFRRTAITRAFDMEQPLREIQAMSGHKDINTLLGYDQHRRSLEYNAINKLNYDE